MINSSVSSSTIGSFQCNYFTMTSSPVSDDNSIAVIKEIYDNSKAEELFEMELERALEIGYHVIVIEPNRLADQTTQWIMIGNCLHKGAVIFGLTSICFCISWNSARHTFRLLIPLATTVSVFCASLYMISWQFDPCCKYQVANGDVRKLKISKRVVDNVFAGDATLSNFPAVLIRKNDTTRKFIHSTVAICALIFTVVRFYK